MKHRQLARRSLMAGMGAAATGLTLGRVSLGAQAAAPARGAFQPARHDADAWLDALPGKHRVIVDTTTANGVSEATLFAVNLFTANKSGYDLDEKDLAIVITLRHFATAFAFTDAIWAKYGKALTDGAEYKPPSGDVPATNPYNRAPRTPLSALAKRGVHFAICNLATRRISRQSAGQGGDAEAIYKELISSALPNGHFVAAGVVAVTRAQEYGYSVLHAG
jgi:hypothetical protein